MLTTLGEIPEELLEKVVLSERIPSGTMSLSRLQGTD